jgi:AraC-like DNA-binding protein
MEQLLFTGRLIQPFLRLLSQYPGFNCQSLERFRAISRENRVEVAAGYESLQYWVRSTGDADLGLKASSLLRLGEAGPLDFAIHSAETVREGVATAQRYSRLYSDALELQLEMLGSRALLRFDSKLPMPRASADFLLGSWYRNHVQAQLSEAPVLECWFAHGPPDSVAEYERLFGRSTLRFNAPCYGFVTEAEFMDAPQASADRSLHSVHCEHLEAVRAGLLAPDDFAWRVRELVRNDLGRRRPTAHGVAKALKVDRRTLARRLEEENTSFTDQLNQVRQQLALGFVAAPHLQISEIASLLGFSHIQGFCRAFKRWTGQTPTHYRANAAAAAAPTGQEPAHPDLTVTVDTV